MNLNKKEQVIAKSVGPILHSKIKETIFSKNYVEYLSEAGWRLERKLPSNSKNYSDLLEDTEWKSNYRALVSSKHYRRDLDALS